MTADAPTATPSSRGPFLKQALALWLGGMIGFVCVLPYLMQLKGENLAEAAAEAGMSPEILLLLAGVQQGVTLVVFVFGGLAASRKLGLETPLTAALVAGGSVRDEVKRWWKPAVVWGGSLGAVVLGLSFAFQPYLPEGFAEMSGGITWWQGLLASFYGGIAEELMLRLFVMSVMALVLRFLFARSRTDLPDGIFWAANVGSAVLFGLGHLPAVMGLMEITGVLVAYAILLNGILGVNFGWLFRKYGIEAAMLAHFTADIVLHVIPALFK